MEQMSKIFNFQVSKHCYSSTCERMNLEKAFCTSMSGFSLLILVLSLLCTAKISSAADTVTAVDSIKDGETIISSGGNFEMGFFSPGNSKYRYVGIWYKKISIKTVVWVANRESPMANTTGVLLRVLNPGILVLSNDTNTIIWSTNSSRPVQNPIAQLLDSGNLVVRDANDDNPDNFLWQSFHHPTDTLLPDMKLGKNFETGREVHLSSWKSIDDPAPGDFIYLCDPTGYPQNMLRKGQILLYRAGPWNGLRFSGAQNSRKNSIYSFGLVFNDKEVYFQYTLLSSVISRYVLNQSGVAQRWTWVDRTQEWILYLTAPNDNCDSYALCGPYGTCTIGNSPVCGCLDKFVPKYPSNWVMGDWSSGCTRNKPLDCPRGDGFLKYSSIKLPDTRNSWYNMSMTLEDCRLKCLKNCSCMAYANADVRNGGSGCLLWFDDLIDIRGITEGQDIYIRVASSELEASNGKKKGLLKVSLSLVTAVILLCLCLAIYFCIRKKKMKDLKLKITDGRQMHDSKKGRNNHSHRNSLELPLFELVTIIKATDSFSPENKLGEGGFGPVYKGVLEEGQEIAVKRLSETSTQGLDEFKNEVTCIAKLQHRNLVRLLGCCIEGEEKMLIYEYMHNKSLDSFIFDEVKSQLLDWKTRFKIIIGIARGLIYLHQDSRLRIIHRDLKASNVLLDVDMNPKISDFGMARSFRENDTGFNTKRVVGTYGYMSPEYQVDGIFSVKSDVFSYGVLVLEIVSGKKNRGYFHPDHHHNLLGHAWKLYKTDRLIELIDENVANSCNLSEVIRSVHVGLLCVQQFPEDRPNISAAVVMLSNESILPHPNEPGFFTERNVVSNIECSSSSQIANSRNDITITLLEPR